MKWKDPIAANELIKRISDYRYKIHEYSKMINLCEIDLIDLLLIPNAEYVFDRLVYDFDNNFWKCRIGYQHKIYDKNDFNIVYKQLYSENHLKEYLCELFEESLT